MQVKLKEGTYNIQGKPVDLTGYVFKLVNGYKVGTRGGYITVDGASVSGFPDRSIRILVSKADCYEPLEGEALFDTTIEDPVTQDPAVEETDDEIIERLRVRFNMLEDMTKAVKKGDVRAMIVSGPPGVGKSFGVERVLDRYNMVQTLGGPKKHEVIKGAMSPIGLYCKLYKYADKDNVIVFDDCDSIFTDETSLNLLKAALDSKKSRTIHWNTDSHKLKNEGVPDQFRFEGSAIFITNLKFNKFRGKLRDHLEALESRCHYIDLTIDTDREKMLRIRQLTNDGMLADYNFTDAQKEEIINYVDENRKRVHELSLRTVLKVSDLVRAFPNSWRDMAEVTVMRRV
jgi:hypothetical protein